MNILYLLIPLSLILVIAAVGAFFWAVRSRQFDDLHTPALKILEDEADTFIPQPALSDKECHKSRASTPPSPSAMPPNHALIGVEGQDSKYNERDTH